MTASDSARASAFGTDPRKYDRARPSYPAALVAKLTGNGAHLRVLDVGCGTGIAGQLFVEHGHEVIGVEHDQRMADIARAKGIDVDVARFEDWTPRGLPFDLVIAAQAWHWIDPGLGHSKAGRALGLGGRLAVFWLEYRHQPQILAAFKRVYAAREPDLLNQSFPLGAMAPNSQWEVTQKYSEAMEASGLFADPEVTRFGSERDYTTEAWLDELPTHSDHGVLPTSRLGVLLDDVGQAVDDLGGQLTVRLTTHLVCAMRK